HPGEIDAAVIFSVLSLKIGVEALSRQGDFLIARSGFSLSAGIEHHLLTGERGLVDPSSEVFRACYVDPITLFLHDLNPLTVCNRSCNRPKKRGRCPKLSFFYLNTHRTGIGPGDARQGQNK